MGFTLKPRMALLLSLKATTLLLSGRACTSIVQHSSTQQDKGAAVSQGSVMWDVRGEAVIGEK
jgi:uncharacterized protein YceK